MIQSGYEDKSAFFLFQFHINPNTHVTVYQYSWNLICEDISDLHVVYSGITPIYAEITAVKSSKLQ